MGDDGAYAPMGAHAMRQRSQLWPRSLRIYSAMPDCHSACARVTLHWATKTSVMGFEDTRTHLLVSIFASNAMPIDEFSVSR